jgi:hypothetical protein
MELNTLNERRPGVAPEELLAQQCLEFGRSLGQQEAVSTDVFHAAMRDQTYAHNLRVASRTPMMLKMLLSSPPKPAQGARPFSSVELARKAAEALARWAKTGFSVVDKETSERRRQACSACPHLSAAPDLAVYKLMPGSARICSLCGCKVDFKLRMPSESCPAPHPEQPGMTRWGEPIKSA